MKQFNMKRLCLSKYWFDSYKDVGGNISSVNPQFYKFLNMVSESCDVSVSDESYNKKTIKFLVTIRTDLTNEVLVPTDGMFFTNCTKYYPTEHPLDDMIMLSAQSLVLQLFDCGEYLPMFIQRTTVYPVGACIINEEPYVYVNVVFDHTLLEEVNFNLKDCELVKIESIVPNSTLEESLLNSLAIVKGENKDVHDDYQG